MVTSLTVILVTPNETNIPRAHWPSCFPLKVAKPGSTGTTVARWEGWRTWLRSISGEAQTIFNISVPHCHKKYNINSDAMEQKRKKQYLPHYLHLMKIPAIIIIFIECLEVGVQVCSHKIRSWNRVSLLWDIMVIVLILRVKQKTSIDKWSLDEYLVGNNISLIYQNIIIAFNTSIKYIFQLKIWSDCIAGVGRQHFEEEWKQRFCWWFHKVPSFR